MCRPEALRGNERWLRDWKRPGEPFGPLVGVDRALLASVSQNDSQLRGSRERPKALSFSATPARGVAGKTALLLRRKLDIFVRRTENIATRFLDGDGSFSPRITAFPSDDIAIRKALRPFGGDGVSSPSFRTKAFPSNDIDKRSDGGDFVGVTCMFCVVAACFSYSPSPRISVTERFLFGACRRESSEWSFTSWENSSCVVGGVSPASVATLV